jgi:hypothetical protein
MKEPLKNGFWRGVLPYTLSGSAGTNWPSLGEHYNSLVPLLGGALHFLGKIWFVEKNEGKIPSISEGGWIRI